LSFAKVLVGIAVGVVAIVAVAVAGLFLVVWLALATITSVVDEEFVGQLGASVAVATVMAELYPTPGPGETPAHPPVPDVDAARARFVEGGELLPGGGRLCLRPDGSGSILMPDRAYLFEVKDGALVSSTEELSDQDFERFCPQEYRGP